VIATPTRYQVFPVLGRKIEAAPAVPTQARVPTKTTRAGYPTAQERARARYRITRRMTVIGPMASMLASFTFSPKLGACTARRLSTAIATWCTGW